MECNLTTMLISLDLHHMQTYLLVIVWTMMHIRVSNPWLSQFVGLLSYSNQFPLICMIYYDTLYLLSKLQVDGVI